MGLNVSGAHLDDWTDSGSVDVFFMHGEYVFSSMESFLFLSGFSFAKIYDSQDSRGRGSLSL